VASASFSALPREDATAAEPTNMHRSKGCSAASATPAKTAVARSANASIPTTSGIAAARLDNTMASLHTSVAAGASGATTAWMPSQPPALDRLATSRIVAAAAAFGLEPTSSRMKAARARASAPARSVGARTGVEGAPIPVARPVPCSTQHAVETDCGVGRGDAMTSVASTATAHSTESERAHGSTMATNPATAGRF